MYRLEEAGEIQAAVQCYKEALADDPELESPKRRLHYLEAQVFCRMIETITNHKSVFEKVPLFSPYACGWTNIDYCATHFTDSLCKCLHAKSDTFMYLGIELL